MAAGVDIPQFLSILEQNDSVLVLHDGIVGVLRAAAGGHADSLCDAIWTPALDASDRHGVAIVAGLLHCAT